MMGVSNAPQYTSLNDLVNDVLKITTEYRNAVLASLQDSVQEGAEIFITEVKKISPPFDNKGIDGHYRNSWTIKPMKKAKYIRYVGNTKKVRAHTRDSKPTIPLINILEFSNNPDKHRPHVGRAVNNSKDQIIELIVRNIGKAGNNAQ